MSEQSAQQNSQPQTPAQHEAEIEARILKHLEPETESQPQEEQQAETETQAEGESQDQPAEQKAEDKDKEELPQLADAEYEGKTYKVPPELKDALMRQSDYTRKTQEAAESKKAAEALMQQIQKQGELQKAQAKIYGRIASLDDQIAQYQNVDWNALTATDAALAQKHFIQYQSLKDQKTKVEGELKTAQEQFDAEAMKVLSTQLEEGRKVLERDIKGWGPELGQKLLQFAVKSYGMSAEEAGKVSDPRLVKLIHDAYQYHQGKEQAAKLSEKKVAQAAPTLKPKGSEARNPQQQEYDADRRGLKSAKTNSERSKFAERLILRKLG